MAEFNNGKSEKEYIRDKGEADKIIETLDNKIFLCKEKLREKEQLVEDKNNIILMLREENKNLELKNKDTEKLKEENDNLKKKLEGHEEVLIKVHEKLKNYSELNTKHEKLKTKYFALKNKK